MDESTWYPDKDDLVAHATHGRGMVLLADGDTAVVRFGHGIEQILLRDLRAVKSVAEAVETQRLAPAREVAARIQGDIITSVNNAWGVFTRSRISLLPHQLWVCHRVARQWPVRMMIADDVGMGKTIEAGLLLWPLIDSRKVQRLLILCPAKLVEQWQIRLKRMFDIRAAVYHSASDTKRNDFWGIHPVVIASLPTLRADHGGRHERLLDAPPWDMVIVDEAHHLHVEKGTGKTLGFQLFERLQADGKITSCVFFTGTPHRGKDYGFWSLMGLLDDKVFGPRKDAPQMMRALPKYLIRNAKQKATDMKGRRLFKDVIQQPEVFRYSPEERHFYDLMTNFIAAGKAYASSLDGQEGGQVVLVLIALQKLAASSVAAVAAALHTRSGRLVAEAKRVRRELAASDHDTETERALSKWMTQEHVRLMENEGRHIDELLKAAAEIKSETRVARVLEIISDRFEHEPVLLFTEYKQTQALVVSALMATYGQKSVGFINGDNRLDHVHLPDGRVTRLHARREESCDAFNRGKTRFLVATEAGGEGIDLQEQCSVLIHVDLPWNPMRLHQRVGRLNRYGQKRAVRVVSLRNPETVESDVWEKLESKIKSIMRALGSAMDEPEDLMQLVLGMTGESFFNQLYADAPGLKAEAFNRWFDQATESLGGASALETVRGLVGHASSFDLSDLKEVPPVDLPDLMPFFKNMLTLNQRRSRQEGLSLSFKTPTAWQTRPAIRPSYESLGFDRHGDDCVGLMGVGHPLLTMALSQAAKFDGALCLVRRSDSPLVVLETTSKITDQTVPVRRILTGVVRQAGEWKVLRDWQVLRWINEIIPVSPEQTVPVDAEELASWRDAACDEAKKMIAKSPELNGPKATRETAMFWPVE